MELSIVEVHSPYLTLECPMGRYYFSENMAARLSSYKSRYGHGVFPFGAEDFVCDHYMIVGKRDGEERVLGTFKIVDYQLCQEFGLTYPLLHTLSHPANEGHPAVDQVVSYMSGVNQREKKLNYIGGMTVCDSLRRDPVHRRKVRQLIATCQVNAVLERDYTELLVTGSVPNRSFQYLEWMGLEKFCPEKVTVWDVGKTEAYVMILRKWSESVMEVAKENEAYWQNRRVVMSEQLEQNRLAG